MLETRIERRPAARVLSFVAAFALGAALLVASSARAQGAGPASGTGSAPSVTATAPAAPTKEQLTEAKKLFEQGLKLKKEGLYQEALASFLEANKLAPRESIQNNLALTYRLLKDLARAYEAYEVLLASYGDKMKPQLKEEAKRAIEALEVLTGVITIGVPEPGAKVILDGKEVAQTPVAKPLRAGIATHQLSITKDGFDPLVQSIDIHGHDVVAVSGPLVKTVLTGHVVADVKQTSPPDPTVLIYVDTADAGPPPYAGDLDPGSHTIEARGQRAVSAVKQLSVEKKGSYTESLELHPSAGTIVVNVDVADSEIAIDGNVIAHGVYEGPTAAGVHALTVSKAGYVQFKKDLIVHDGDRIIENVPLLKEGQAALAPPPHDWKGVYSQLGFVGLFELTKPTNDVAQGVGFTPGTTINGSSIFGGGLDVHVGYSFGLVGIEGAVLLGYDHSSANVAVTQATVTHPGVTPRTEDYGFHRVGGTIAVGARLMPKTQVIRPTLGVAAGVALKTVFYSRSIENTSSNETTSPAFYAAPSIMVDGGIELGSTPGTRFYLGCLLVADFAAATPVTTSFTDTNYPPPTVLNGVNGTDLFIGPILGMQFGE